MIESFIQESDFLNLSAKDIEKIADELTIDIPKENKLTYLYDMKNLIIENENAKKVLENKILCGKTSVKWYQYEYIRNDKNKNDIIKILESDTFFYNKENNIALDHLNTVTIYKTIKKSRGVYMIKFLVPGKVSTVKNGATIDKMRNIDTIVSIIDINKKIIEIRSNVKECEKIINYIKNLITIISIDGIKILKNYNGSLVKFKDDLNEGVFFNSNSIPSINLNLSDEDNNLLVNTIKLLDEYFKFQDEDKLLKGLKSLNIQDNNIIFSRLLVAGMSRFCISLRPENNNDLSNQGLYNILKEHTDDSVGMIKFKHPNSDYEITIQVGIRTNSIYFKTSVDEFVIDYIRNKII